MKKIKLSEFLSLTNVKRAVALMMILAMLSFAGCDKDKNNSSSSSSGNSSNASSETEVSGEDGSDASTDSTESESSSGSSVVGATSTYINPASGEIDGDYETQSVSVRTDAEEREISVDPSNMAYNYVGYAEKERNALLKEILNTKNTLDIYDVKGKIYYISPSGENTNDGTSPEKAIKTLDAIGSLPLVEGDALLFERNSIYRMSEVVNLKTGVTYGSYGKGRKPILLGSPENFAERVWKPSNKRNVWEINYMYTYPAGMFFGDVTEYGYQKLSLKALQKNTDFYYDEENATLYLYCDKGNPSKVWDDIEISGEKTCMFMSSSVHDLVVDNICIRFTGWGATVSLYNNYAITVTNCEFGFTGGTWLGSVRAGNAMGTWCAGKDMNWNHNWIYHTFDSALSPQGNQGNHDYNNISICNNLLEYNNCDIESWESSTLTGTYHRLSTYSNNHYDNNICRFTSLGWGTRSEDGGIRGIDGVHYGGWSAGQIKDISFNNNIIDCPGRMIYKLKMGTATKQDYDNFERKGNVYYIKQSMRTTNQLTFQFCWKDENTLISQHSANNKAETLKAFNEFEPDATVYWYK